MFCTKCGAPMPDNAQFCTTCGAPLAAPSPYQGQPPAPRRRTGVAVALGIVIGVAAVVIAVIALILGRQANESPDSQAQSEQANPPATTQNASRPTLDLHVSQVDNSLFPTVTLYASIEENGSQPAKAVSNSLFTLTELSSDGTAYIGTVDSIAPLAIGDAMNIDLVLDQSGSMSSDGKMTNAKAAANAFVDEITTAAGNVAEITAFASYVYNVQPFTNDATLLKSAVDSLVPNGETALYDALFWALQRTNLKSGSRVVIAFTDGEENASHYSQSDVVELSHMTGIPVYIVGIGNDVNRMGLQSLATQCNGSYFDASTANLQATLSDIYGQIYADQRSMYRIVYTSTYTGDESSYRTVHISCADGSGYVGETETTYMPVDNVSSFETYVNAQDYVLSDSGSRYYSRAELEKLSLWELYLARNEIFARYGRGFKNQDLVEYFATKRWYHQTATPEEFDAKPSPLNDYEMKNTETMLAIEKERNSPYITQNRV